MDNKGVYLHTADSGRRQRDTNFQGFGRFTTGSKGEYRFRTIKPVPYTGRTPHIHVKVKKGGRELLTTQIFVNGHPQNQRRHRSRAASATRSTANWCWSISSRSRTRRSASCRPASTSCSAVTPADSRRRRPATRRAPIIFPVPALRTPFQHR